MRRFPSRWLGFADDEGAFAQTGQYFDGIIRSAARPDPPDPESIAHDYEHSRELAAAHERVERNPGAPLSPARHLDARERAGYREIRRLVERRLDPEPVTRQLDHRHDPADGGRPALSILRSNHADPIAHGNEVRQRCRKIRFDLQIARAGNQQNRSARHREITRIHETRRDGAVERSTQHYVLPRRPCLIQHRFGGPQARLCLVELLPSRRAIPLQV